MAKLWDAKQKEWSRAIMVRPKDNIVTEGLVRAHHDKRFIPSYERDNSPECMTLIMAGEYARIWIKERNESIKQRKRAAKTKRIKNDIQAWVEKHRTTKNFV